MSDHCFLCRIAWAWYESEDARERIRFPQAVQLVNLRDFKFGFDANFSWCFVFKGHELWFHQEEQAIVLAPGSRVHAELLCAGLQQ